MKNAVVTGAGSGIGQDVCRDLLASGWTVYGMDVSREGLQQSAEMYAGSSGRFVPVQCDVADSASVRAAFARVAKETPALDALVCSAGIFRTGPLLDMREEDFAALFDVNTKGAWLCAKTALPLLEQGAHADAPSRIVFVASIAAIRPKVGGGGYGASKAALTQIAKVLAVELAPRSILVNAIAPSTVETAMTRKLAADAAHNGYTVSGVSPLGRVAMPADVTPVIRFLLADDSRYVTGVVLPIDGGTSAAFQPPKANQQNDKKEA